MTASRDPDRLIHAFFNEGLDELPDPVYDAVRDRIEQTRQRAVIGPWRTQDVSNLLKIGLAAAAVVLIAVVGYNLLPGSPGGPGGEPSATPEPTATVEPSPSPASAPRLTQTFTSTLHGYSLSYPEGWTAQAATEPWTESTFPLSFGVPQVDFLYDTTLTNKLFLAIASQPIGDSTPEDWVAEQMASEEGCTTTEPIAVDGGMGVIGCTQAFVTTAGRGYWIQLYTGESAPAAYDLAWFEEVLATVQLHPEDAVN